MAHGSGDWLVVEFDESPRMATKRKFDEEPRSWDGGKAAVPAAPGPSCSNVRPPRTDATQSSDDLVHGSFEKFKRSRMEAAKKGQIDQVHTDDDDNYKWFHNLPAKKTFSIHREQDAQFYIGEASNQPRKIDTPKLKASTDGAVNIGANLTLRSDKGNMSLNLTEELLRLLNQENVAMKAVLKNNGGDLHVSFRHLES